MFINKIVQGKSRRELENYIKILTGYIVKLNFRHPCDVSTWNPPDNGEISSELKGFQA